MKLKQWIVMKILIWFIFIFIDLLKKQKKIELINNLSAATGEEVELFISSEDNSSSDSDDSLIEKENNVDEI